MAAWARSTKCTANSSSSGFGALKLVGVAKGPDRKPGQERLFVLWRCRRRSCPGPDSQALRVIQRIRDEAHRFAITGHRKRRARRHNESVLEAIPGLGPGEAARAAAALRRHAGTDARRCRRPRGGQRNRDNAGAHPL